MMSDWGVHLNDIVLWALEAKGPQVGLHPGRHLHHRRQPRHARHAPGRLRVPRVHPDLLDAQGERAEAQRPRLRHPLLRHRRQPDARPRAASRSSPTRPSCPTASSCVHGDRPLRKIDLEAREGQGRGRPERRTSRTSSSASRPRQLPTTDIEIAHRSTNTCHLGNIAYKVGRKLEWDVRHRDDQERPRGQCPA